MHRIADCFLVQLQRELSIHSLPRSFPHAQEILAERCCELGGPDAISNNANVVDFIDERDAAGHVTAILSDGRRVKGDLLVGADGIWSKVGWPGGMGVITPSPVV